MLQSNRGSSVQYNHSLPQGLFGGSMSYTLPPAVSAAAVICRCFVTGFLLHALPSCAQQAFNQHALQVFTMAPWLHLLFQQVVHAINIHVL